MNWLNMSLWFLGAFALGILHTMYRNERVFRFRVDLLERDYEAYKSLPSYNYMMNKFWVWPLKKFLPRKEET